MVGLYNYIKEICYMKIEIVKMNVDDIHTRKSICTSWQTKENIIVIDGENNCIFGEGYLSILDGEIDVIRLTDCNPDEICLAMHSSGRFCKTDFKRFTSFSEKQLSQFGFPSVCFLDCCKELENDGKNMMEDLF